MEQIDAAGHMAGLNKAGADVFRRARRTGVDRVDVQLVVIQDIAANHRALQKMHVVEAIYNARGIIKILQCAFAVFAFFDIDDVNCRACCTVVDLFA